MCPTRSIGINYAAFAVIRGRVTHKRSDVCTGTVVIYRVPGASATDSQKEDGVMSTPGRRRALKALGRRKRLNKARVKAGKKPIIGGKKVSLSTYNKIKRAGRPRKR